MFARSLSLILLSILLAPSLALADHCIVSKIAVIPGSWENTAMKVSLTLQAQNDTGELCHVAQTLRFSLESSGTFTGQTGNDLQLYISTNSANRNFYYESSTLASDTITAKAGYGVADSWETTYTTTYTPSTQITSTDTQSSDNSGASNTSSDTSSHFSSAPVSSAKAMVKLEVGAGRNRLSTVSTPIEFRADTGSGNANQYKFNWSMGDGSVKYGQVVSHTYVYPGDYTVVLNTVGPDSSTAVSRTSVKVVEPNLALSRVFSDRIEVTNNSISEINLYGRALVSGSKVFRFPQDTIIAAKAQANFASNVTGLYEAGYLGAHIVVASINTTTQEITAQIEKKRLERAAEIAQELAMLQNQLAVAESGTKPSVATALVQMVATPDPKPQVLGMQDIKPIVGKKVETEIKKESWLDVIKRFFLGNDE